ncbi:hypothetical protein ACWOBE_05030 [Hutsoniella sourekii]
MQQDPNVKVIHRIEAGQSMKAKDLERLLYTSIELDESTLFSLNLIYILALPAQDQTGLVNKTGNRSLILATNGQTYRSKLRPTQVIKLWSRHLGDQLPQVRQRISQRTGAHHFQVPYLNRHAFFIQIQREDASGEDWINLKEADHFCLEQASNPDSFLWTRDQELVFSFWINRNAKQVIQVSLGACKERVFQQMLLGYASQTIHG